MVAAPPNEVFSAAAFLGMVVVCIPLPWHLHAWNTGTCLYIMWVALACFNQFINSVVWNKHALNLSPVWCDVSSRLIIGIAVAIPASSLCVVRRLYKISQVSVVSKSRAEKRREILVDLSIGLGIPIVQMAVQIVVEGHRFDVFQRVGCMPFTYNVTLAYPLVWAWPLAIGLVTICYAIPCLLAFYKRQSEFSQFLASGSSLNTNRYLRLMILSGLEACLTIPLSVYVIIVNSHVSNLNPWISWEDTHFGYSRVDLVPEVLWRGTLVESGLESGRWMNVACAFIFFAFFGTGNEAMKHYRMYYEYIRKVLGVGANRSGIEASSSSMGQDVSERTLPVYVCREKITKRCSIDTFASSVASAMEEAVVDLTTDKILSRPRSTSIPQTLPGTPLLPSFAPPDENTASSPSAHFAPQRSLTVKSAVSSTSSFSPSSGTAFWSRTSASLSQAEVFMAEASDARGGNETYEKGLPPFPRSPTVGDRSSAWLTRTNTVRTVTIPRPPPLVLSRESTECSPPRRPMRPPPPNIKADGHTRSFLDLSSPSSVVGFGLYQH